MSGEWSAEKWVGWLRRGRTDSAPSWQGTQDCAKAIGDELARLRVVEANHTALTERISALSALVVSNPSEAFRASAWDMLLESKKPERQTMTRDTEFQKTEVLNYMVEHDGRQEYWMWDMLTPEGMLEVSARWWATQ